MSNDIEKGIMECLDLINKLREQNITQAAEIVRLQADLATARWDGMEEATRIGDRHIEIAEVLAETETDKKLIDNIKMQVGAMRQVVDAIRAAAKEVKP